MSYVQVRFMFVLFIKKKRFGFKPAQLMGFGIKRNSSLSIAFSSLYTTYPVQGYCCYYLNYELLRCNSSVICCV